jgi:hypothetical protein
MKIQKIVLLVALLTTILVANDELANDIKYISNDGTETQNQIICTNGNEAYVFSNNKTHNIRLVTNGMSENLGKITLNTIVNKVCK